MPSRIIKESITTSESLSEVSADAERLFWRLVVKADDFGLYYGNPRILASMCFPLDPPKEQKIRAWLSELVAAGMVGTYTASEDGKQYLKLMSWDKHQQQRAKKSKFPLPVSFDNTCNQRKGNQTFGTTAQMENDAAKQARAADLAAYQDQINSQIAERDSALSAMKAEARAATAQREAEIAAAKAESAVAGNGNTEPDWSAYANTDPGDIGNVDRVGSVGSIDEDVNIADEDLKFLRDVAEMRYVQNFVTLTPTVAVDAKISEKVDVDEVVDKIERRLETEFEAAAEGVYA